MSLCIWFAPHYTICDQLAMARLARATFALLLALLLAAAAAIGVVVLRQTPTVIEVIGILLVMSGVAVHFDKVNPRELAENAAVVAVLAYAIANLPEPLPKQLVNN
jgi:threonine/homoserine efflux transporter RhtA